MEVTDELIGKLAHLARLSFNESEKEEIRKDLEKMIAFVDKLNELDLEGVEPLTHFPAEKNTLREDKVGKTVSREDALRNALVHDDQFFKVPKVIKNPNRDPSD
jgi:aspartyl-tRNA(Asn)/glutamyl-tRNA(Gln) amidotransferase subunit C